MSLFYKLAISMGFVVMISNYLVQFPVKYFGLNEILTYGAFSYPITFLITDLANRAYGKIVARQIVYIGFFIGVCFTLLISLLGLGRCSSTSRQTTVSNISLEVLSKSLWTEI